jgi:hypothetical protein
MIPTTDTPPPGPGQNAQFTTTHWSVVLAAGGGDSPAARQALEYLCQTYWYPVYAYVRRRGHSPEDAEDLTQEFFARLIERNDFAKVSREREPFRAFLKGALNHLLSDQRDYVRAAKRGGGKIILSLDAQTWPGPTSPRRSSKRPMRFAELRRRWPGSRSGSTWARGASGVVAGTERKRPARCTHRPMRAGNMTISLTLQGAQSGLMTSRGFVCPPLALHRKRKFIMAATPSLS